MLACYRPTPSSKPRVHGVSHFARVREWQIEWEGALYDTPSAASIALRKTQVVERLGGLALQGHKPR